MKMVRSTGTEPCFRPVTLVIFLLFCAFLLLLCFCRKAALKASSLSLIVATFHMVHVDALLMNPSNHSTQDGRFRGGRCVDFEAPCLPLPRIFKSTRACSEVHRRLVSINHGWLKVAGGYAHKIPRPLVEIQRRHPPVRLHGHVSWFFLQHNDCLI
jgi:hypothetical protein